MEAMRENIANPAKIVQASFYKPKFTHRIVYEEEIHGEESSKSGESRQRPPFMDNTQWNHLPKIDMNKFDGSDPAGWVTQMEHYFSIHNITYDMAKLRVAVLYFNLERWQWW